MIPNPTPDLTWTARKLRELEQFATPVIAAMGATIGVIFLGLAVWFWIIDERTACIVVTVSGVGFLAVGCAAGAGHRALEVTRQRERLRRSRGRSRVG